jgi:hypothetical protein
MRTRLLWVLWPSFLVAAAAETLCFTLLDPEEMMLLGTSLEWSRQAVYTIGFLFFWAVGASASALTVFLQRSPWELNRCPLPALARPEGCPKREGC